MSVFIFCLIIVVSALFIFYFRIFKYMNYLFRWVFIFTECRHVGDLRFFRRFCFVFCAVGIAYFVFVSLLQRVDLYYSLSPPWPSGLKRWSQTLVPVVRARFEPRCGRPHFAPTRSGVRVCGRNRTEAREREWAEGTVSSLPGTLNVRIKLCHSTGIARSGGGVRASTTSYA